jgi:WD40 repeat protein
LTAGTQGSYRGGQGSVIVWDAGQTTPKITLPAYGAVTHVSFAPHEETVYFSTNANSCSRGGGGVFSWNADATEAKQMWSAFGNSVVDFVNGEHGVRVASIGQTGESLCTGRSVVTRWNISDGHAEPTFFPTGNLQNITPDIEPQTLALRPDGNRLAVGDASGKVYLLDWGSGSVNQTIAYDLAPIRRIVFLAHNMLGFSTGDGYIRVYRIP